MKSTVFKNVTENKTTICSHLSRHFNYCVADEAGYLTSVFIVSPSGIHISLGTCVRGYVCGDTHITQGYVCGDTHITQGYVCGDTHITRDMCAGIHISL